ncbi:MAG: YwiC-like family protein [Firmicutes bacterium]|nr:YwiC-like family protein [Bacillota bacterium]
MNYPLRMPAEHGAWGILLVPYLTAVLMLGTTNLSVLLVLVAAVALFLVRGSADSHGTWRVLTDPRHLLLFSIGVLAGGWLVLAERRHVLLVLLAAVGTLYLLQKALAQHPDREIHEKRSLAAELVGVVLLTLVVPATWVAARGELDRSGLQLWLLNLLFFAGGVIYVKYRVRGLLAHRPFQSWAERVRFAWPVLTYHLLLVAFLIAASARDALPTLTVLAFMPGMLRALGLVRQLGKRFPIRRLGWSEVAQAIVFAALLVLSLKFSP